MLEKISVDFRISRTAHSFSTDDLVIHNHFAAFPLTFSCGVFYSVTRNYFENLVQALETGLNAVGPSTSQSTGIKNTTSKSLGGKSKSGKNRASAAGSKSGSSSRGDVLRFARGECDDLLLG